jgi:hypothetical protein
MEEIPFGYCHCGCGEKTKIAPWTDNTKGWIKGQPNRFIRYHAVRLRKRVVVETFISPDGLCFCGCGQKAPLAQRDDPKYGYIKGKPMRYIDHHYNLGNFGPRVPIWDVREEGRVATGECKCHGVTTFVLAKEKMNIPRFRCRQCRTDNSRHVNQRIKMTLVEEHGGKCKLCGYDNTACLRAFHFHHIDPMTKKFQISRSNNYRSLKEARVEAAKCILLCSNCHAEVEDSLRHVV